jgi:hypothetical protein
MSEGATQFAQGGCTCRAVRYVLLDSPLFVHGCHCTWCQRETGSAFAINALIETDRVRVLAGEPELTATPSNSGKGQEVFRCPTCRVALWSHYGAAGRAVSFVRVGTLDEPNRCPPDIHIFTATKLDWVRLPEGVPVVAEYYRRSAYWPSASVQRYKAAVG